MKIVVDAFGGDNAPLEILKGAEMAVKELDVEKDKVKVVVSMFGRETPVELELDQVQLDD